MFDLSPYARPRPGLDLADGIEILREARLALDAIGRKLAIMRKLAASAADPKCDPFMRIELNLLFTQLKKEIDEWAACSSGGVQLLNNGK